MFPVNGILDNFNRADEGPPPTGWIAANSPLGDNIIQVVSNNCGPIGLTTGGVQAAALWNGSQFGPDVEVYMDVPNLNGGDVILFARIDNTNKNGYAIEGDSSGFSVNRIDGGGETQLGSTISFSFSSNDSIGMSIVGSTISVYHKPSGGSWILKDTRTDATYNATGYIGLGSYGQDVGFFNTKFDNFGGGTISNNRPFSIRSRMILRKRPKP